ncbi:hypothetical protein [Robiginitalea sediminis]|uniref:hypothetical protein n=1 Tax=Robiginitalea sediminis TaxID=1982593 RepID=UPI000B4AC8B6|nr:hypothetical protein [Robiginitalea sediminis]
MRLFYLMLMACGLSFAQERQGLDLEFPPFTLHFEPVETLETPGKGVVFQDTARVYLGLGETLEHTRMRFTFKEKGTLQVRQRFENSLTVMDEGPHCDLTEWKHYRGDWERLPYRGGAFVLKGYSPEDGMHFPEVTRQEVVAAVREHCGEQWAALAAGAPEALEYPVGVGMNRIYLWVEFFPVSGAGRQEFFVVLELPMGC